MIKQTLIIVTILALISCGSQPVKPTNTKDLLISALIAQDQFLINTEKNKLQLGTKNNNIISLYLLALQDQPYKLISNSQIILQNMHHYNLHQQIILKQLLLWAYVHPIYRQETAKQVRILQRETLLVAPSNIDFPLCETNNEGCANNLRQQLTHIIAPQELTEALTQMAENDPCINLSDENLEGDFANQCLASRKGSLKINLISTPKFLFNQWLSALVDTAEI
jgi:hypothetical protein